MARIASACTSLIQKTSRKRSNNDGRIQIRSFKFRKIPSRLDQWEWNIRISETIDKREAGQRQTMDEIIDKAENITLKGMNNSMAAMNYFES